MERRPTMRVRVSKICFWRFVKEHFLHTHRKPIPVKSVRLTVTTNYCELDPIGDHVQPPPGRSAPLTHTS